jgi:hypothetical protein
LPLDLARRRAAIVLYYRAVIARQPRRKQPARYPTLRMLGFAIIAGIALASCNSSSNSGKGAAADTSSTSAGSGANASDIKACNLLTLAEIKQATGATMGAGLLQTTDTQASCDWNAPDGAPGASAVGIIVQNYDDSLWQAMSGSKYATPVTGIGEKAFKGVPHKGDLSVKVGKYEVDVGIVDFHHDDATVDAAALQLMKLVLSRL